MKLVIFDFNRTIYDPVTKGLLPDVEVVLGTLINRGFDLYLVSRGNQRKDLIDSLGISNYFKEIIVSNTKSKRDFETIIAQEAVDIKSSFVMGDRVRKEITSGNTLGLKTIWLRQGKFANELPRNSTEQPNHVVKRLKDTLDIVK